MALHGRDRAEPGAVPVDVLVEVFRECRIPATRLVTIRALGHPRAGLVVLLDCERVRADASANDPAVDFEANLPDA
jgi:hypothetical protein